MSAIRAVLARIAGLVHGRGADAEVREELESHVEMEAAEYVRRGMAPDDARRRPTAKGARHGAERPTASAVRRLHDQRGKQAASDGRGAE